MLPICHKMCYNGLDARKYKKTGAEFLMRKNNFAIFLIPIFILSLFSLGGCQKETEESTVITNSQYPFQIEIPGNWREVEYINLYAVHEAKRSANSAALWTVFTDMADLKDGMTIEDFAQKTAQEITSDLEESKETFVQKYTINGYDAIQYEISGLDTSMKPTYDTTYLFTAIKIEEYYVCVYGCSFTKVFEEVRPELQQITETFKATEKIE